MALDSGTRLGPYEVLAPLGAGGMGEVYRARDTKLQRDVALKVLPAPWAGDAERLARFAREAQVLASLNHPHIAQIYAIEDAQLAAAASGEPVQAIVMELVEGPTLADRIAGGSAGPTGLPMDEALAIASQIAEALESAHEQGIVHRDLKPANVKVRDDGTVKVLDFGLAKLAAPAAAGTVSSLTLSPTITSPAMTQLGVILGTAAYMSPEQAKGREADKRSDVWAFGAVLYEMLTGRAAFDGEDVVDVLGAVARLEPDWSRLPADVPPAVVTLLKRCLQKDRRQRLSDISAARFVLSELNALTPAQPVPSAVAANVEARPSRKRAALITGSVAALAAVIAGTGAWTLRPAPLSPAVARFSFSLPSGQSFSGGGRQVVAISPDGTQIAYVADRRLWIRSLDGFEPRPVPGIEGTETGIITEPMFAPDGGSIAYFSLGEDNANLSTSVLKRIPVAGGAPATLSTLVDNLPFGASWGPGGVLVGTRSGIFRVPTAGGPPERIVEVGKGEVAHGPRMLPDGQTVLFTLAQGDRRDDQWDSAKLVLHSLKDGKRRVLLEGASDARYLSAGRIAYAVSGTLFVAPFDLDTLAFTGSPVPALVGVSRSVAGGTGTAHVAISEGGTVVYRPGPATASGSVRSLVVGDDKGDSVTLKVPNGNYVHPRVSYDGRAVAVARREGDASDVWTYELSGSTAPSRLTLDGTSQYPVWSADSRRVIYESNAKGAQGIYWRAADGSGAAERLTTAAEGEQHIPESASRDGSRLLFSVLKQGTYSLSVLTFDGKKIARFGTATSLEPPSATFSPDGQWVAYAATPVTGGVRSPDRGVFVEPFPATGARHKTPQLALDYHPVWSPDGRNIYFVPSSNRPTVAVPVSTRPAVTFGTPVELPRAPRPGVVSTGIRGYDVLPDGRFVSLGPPGGAGGGAASASDELRVVVNWFEELKRNSSR